MMVVGGKELCKNIAWVVWVRRSGIGTLSIGIAGDFYAFLCDGYLFELPPLLTKHTILRHARLTC